MTLYRVVLTLLALTSPAIAGHHPRPGHKLAKHLAPMTHIAVAPSQSSAVEAFKSYPARDHETAIHAYKILKQDPTAHDAMTVNTGSVNGSVSVNGSESVNGSVAATGEGAMPECCDCCKAGGACEGNKECAVEGAVDGLAICTPDLLKYGVEKFYPNAKCGKKKEVAKNLPQCCDCCKTGTCAGKMCSVIGAVDGVAICTKDLMKLGVPVFYPQAGCTGAASAPPTHMPQCCDCCKAGGLCEGDKECAVEGAHDGIALCTKALVSVGVEGFYPKAACGTSPSAAITNGTANLPKCCDCCKSCDGCAFKKCSVNGQVNICTRDMIKIGVEGFYKGACR